MARAAKKAAVDAGPVEGPWELPEGWRWERLGALVEKSSAKHLPDTASELRFVGLEHIPPHKMTITGDGAFRDMRSAGSAFSEGDVLYGRLRPYLNKVWKATFAGACSGELLVLCPFEGLEASYLAYVLHGPDFISFASRSVTGDRPRMDFSAMANFPVPLPHPAVQTAIVNRIDELFAEIDDGDQALASAQRDVKLYRDALLLAGALGTLTADWRLRNASDMSGSERLEKLLAERPKRSKGRPTTVPEASQLPQIPPGWCWANVDLISVLVIDGDHNPPKRADAGVPHLTARNIKGGRLSFENTTFVSAEGYAQTRARYDPAADDLIITCVGTLGETAIVPQGAKFSADRNLAAVRLLPGVMDPRFLQVWLDGPFVQHRIKSASGSTAQPHLYLKDIRSLPVPCPPIEEQWAALDALAELLRLPPDLPSAAASAGLRQSILAAAFRGDLVA